jgi:uncharacterized protein YciI
MIYRLVLFAMLFGAAPLAAQDAEQKLNPNYDQELAESLGADDYGMRQYVMAYLKAGPNRDRSPEEAADLQAAHMANIGRMAEEGKLALAGPFLDNGEVRGIYIFATDSIEEAREWTASDPAIKAGSLEMELHPWYGSAALMQVNETHDKLSRIQF